MNLTPSLILLLVLDQRRRRWRESSIGVRRGLYQHQKQLVSLSIPTSFTTLYSTTDSTTNSIHNSHCKKQYTIDDTVCPPTRPHVLQTAVIKACSSLDQFLAKKPIAQHTRQAFETLLEMITVASLESESLDNNKTPKDLILDSGCGTGRSTRILGKRNPDCWVIGVDRSFDRISRKTTIKELNGMHADATTKEQSSLSFSKRPFCHQVSQNTFLVRAELVDFWRLLLQQQQQQTDKKNKNNNNTDDDHPYIPLGRIRHHYLLYPNPYPTQKRLTQRWYAHPSFPLLLQVGGAAITIRSNWEGYLAEFAKAVEIANDYYDDSCQQQQQQQQECDLGMPRPRDASLENANDDNKSNSTRAINFAAPYVTSARRGPTRRADKSMAWTNFEQKYDNVGEETFQLVLRHDSEQTDGTLD